ncbi:MAG: T9SS type A sorting domain-containing protein [Lentisphaeria bacterium]|nr:T9SS type A sorting domain-containing protein [Candidatus Neomarinimicrobiota bacterium]MCF7841607.1 T9SS type A sorting domain-containing protein [Lentisphaeria bacterium]
MPFFLNGWGWGSHRYINEHALDYLPPEMAFFQSQRDFIREHSVDPDQSDNRPGYWHYIDIDYYPEFFQGTLPTAFADVVALYDYNTVIDQGTVPWAIMIEMDSVSTLMAAGEWAMAWQAVADLGHYVADSHQPMHLTLNYNGQLTGNYGIHSRYETTLINPRLDALPLPTGMGSYWESPLDSVFGYIGEIYPYVDMVIEADDAASAVDPNYNNTYYTMMWEALDEITTDAIHSAILDLANIWYTAWIDAGSPYPPGMGTAEDHAIPMEFTLQQNYPNPFNPVTTISYHLRQAGRVRLTITDVAGDTVRQYELGEQGAGNHAMVWDGQDHSAQPVAAGIYFARLAVNGASGVIKMTYVK